MDSVKISACKLYSVIFTSVIVAFLLGYSLSGFGKWRPKHRSYLIFFPSNGDEIFLERCNNMNYYWELPGGGEDEKDFGSRFRTMQREWREETGFEFTFFQRCRLHSEKFCNLREMKLHFEIPLAKSVA